MTCKFCGAEVKVNHYCEYCDRFAEPSYYPESECESKEELDSRDIESEYIANGCIYTVKRGDTLWGIARRFYGCGSAFLRIAKANKIKDANCIRVGMELTIP